MGVLYGKYNLLDKLTAYNVRPAPQDLPGKFETGMCGMLGALEYIEWVGETFGPEQDEGYHAGIAGRYFLDRLSIGIDGREKSFFPTCRHQIIHTHLIYWVR